MRLLNTLSLLLEDFVENAPPYAILSHTWEAEEVLFKDMENGSAHLKQGYKRSSGVASLLLRKDKSSSAELSEAINSMYAYYEHSRVCYVYLDEEIEGLEVTQEDLRKARWTYRGWTLQELIAPAVVNFCDRHWKFRGTRETIATALHEVTGIDVIILNRSQSTKLGLRGYSIAQRMSWAANRATTRKEDLAYCLFGIFGVYLAPLYGEGPRRAFERLQQEIIKDTTDLSFLAWDVESDLQDPQLSPVTNMGWSALAIAPKNFKSGPEIWNDRANPLEPFYTTNKGLCLTLPLVRHPSGDFVAALTDCYMANPGMTPVGIFIRLYDPKDNFYYRSHMQAICAVTPAMLEQARVETFYLASRDVLAVRRLRRRGYN